VEGGAEEAESERKSGRRCCGLPEGSVESDWGGLIVNRAPALLRRAFCVVRAPRPKSRRPEKVGLDEVAWRCPPPTPGAKDGEGLDAGRGCCAPRALGRSSARRRSSWTAASAVQESVDEGQARVDRFVVIAPCPRRHLQPDAAVLLESHRGFVVKASLRLSPGPRLGSEGVHNRIGRAQKSSPSRGGGWVLGRQCGRARPPRAAPLGGSSACVMPKIGWEQSSPHSLLHPSGWWWLGDGRPSCWGRRGIWTVVDRTCIDSEGR
jgi:hypothetical protein